ncbi:hypothetical protein LNP26_00165 [Klebsiella variicola subsp. variicola]|nr:hypothetical protein [Klebsiella variicola subsp. variicola]
MSKKQEMPNTGYAIIRCDDGVIVARLTSFPVCERALDVPARRYCFVYAFAAG